MIKKVVMFEMYKIFALLSGIFAALVAITGKIGLEKIDSTLGTTIRSIVMALFLISISIFLSKFKSLGDINKKDLFFIIFSGISGSLSWIFYFMALSQASNYGTNIVVALDRLSLVFVYIFSVIFLSVELTVTSIFAITLITIGTILLSIK